MPRRRWWMCAGPMRLPVPAPLVTVHVPFDQLRIYRLLVMDCDAVSYWTALDRAAQRLAAAGHEVVGYLDGGVQALNTPAVTSETSLR